MPTRTALDPLSYLERWSALTLPVAYLFVWLVTACVECIKLMVDVLYAFRETRAEALELFCIPARGAELLLL